MDDALSSNEVTIDYALLEKVNPVFHTAKMTLFQLAANEDPDAAMLVENMGLTQEETQNSANSTASPEQVLGGTIMLETRYRTMASLAEGSGYTLVDLPCGYTPRAISFAKKGLPYYGLDLPVVIREISEQVKAMVSPEERELIHYREVDATNYASLEKAVDDIDGEVCINTEGLLMYFTDSEAGALCGNIRRILEKKGGCWYVADPESSLQYVITMRALVGDRFAEIMQNAKQQTKDKSDVEIGKNSLITSPADMEGTTKRAMAFLAEHGLRAWMPLYLTGAVRPYHYPRMRDGVRMRSLFVARGRCALVSSSVQGMEGDGLCVMIDDADAVGALEREFDAYLGLCHLLAQVERPASRSSFESTLAAYRNADGAVAAEVGNAVICANPGHGALLASADASIVYRIDEPRLVDAIASFAEHIKIRL